jgi:hypothetical protein
MIFMTFISMHSVIICVVFSGAYMRCTRLCSLKPGCDNFSVSGFAAALKPSEPFDGTFYKRWRSKMILWLNAMNCYHAA